MPENRDAFTGGGSDGPLSSQLIVLRDHQVAERLLDDLLAADFASPGYALLLARASMLGSPILAAVSRRIDAFNPTLLDALGRVLAVYPEVREAVASLRRTAADRRLTDRRRMGAVMLLEQAFGLQPPEDFLATLREPVQSATGLLLTALDNHRGNPSALRDYLRALVFQPLDLLYSVLAALSEASDDRTIEVLRLLALQADPDLQAGAIEALAARGSEQAQRALQALEYTLPDEMARLANRHLQKLRLTGTKLAALRTPDAECRAWLSAIDGRGDCLLWLAVPQQSAGKGYALLGMLLNDSAGVLDAIGAGGVKSDSLPAATAVGTLHERLDLSQRGALPNGASLGEHEGGYLAIPFGYALRLLGSMVRLNWLYGTPLPVEYQLLNGAIWEYGGGAEAEEPEESVRALEEGTAGRAEPSGSDYLDGAEPEDDQESDLLFDNLFNSWYLEGEAVRSVARDVAQLGGNLPDELTDDNWKMLLPALIRLAHDEFGPDLRALYAGRLRRMAEWYLIAGRRGAALLSIRCAQTMLKSPPEANLFVLRLVQKGILVALAETLRFTRS